MARKSNGRLRDERSRQERERRLTLLEARMLGVSVRTIKRDYRRAA